MKIQGSCIKNQDMKNTEVSLSFLLMLIHAPVNAFPRGNSHLVSATLTSRPPSFIMLTAISLVLTASWQLSRVKGTDSAVLTQTWELMKGKNGQKKLWPKTNNYLILYISDIIQPYGQKLQFLIFLDFVVTSQNIAEKGDTNKIYNVK